MQHRTLGVPGGMRSVVVAAFILIAGAALYAGGQAEKAAPIAAKPTIDVTQLTPDQWANLDPKGEILSVTISGAPVVKFRLTDAKGNGLVGLGNFTSKPATAAVTTFPNIAFALAKLVPESAATNEPSKWVSYNVTTVPTVAAPAVTPRVPATDNAGTLVDNGDGSYQYTFYRDITKTKDIVAASADDSAKNLFKADLGDTAFVPTLTHRLVLQFSGNARGTGSNTANGVTVATAVPMKKPINVIFDFVPATGKPVSATDTQRELVAIQNCNECHAKLALHGGGRVDTRYCVTCHTDQLKYGQAEAATTATGFSGPTNKIDGLAAGDFLPFIHRLPRGTELSKTGYNVYNIKLNEVTYPMLGGGQAMCSKCHANAAQAENWNTKPTVLACGTCHDSVNFKTGDNHPAGASDNSKCATCHTPADIKGFHQTLNVTPHNPTVAAGLVNFVYEIKTATATATDVKVVFKITADGKPVTFAAPATPMTAPLVGFTGSPGFLLAYALPQEGMDGKTVKLIDYNNLGSGVANFQTISVSIANLLDTANAAAMGTLTGPDANGYYTAVIVNKKMFPAGAKLRSVSLQGYFSQVTAPGTDKAPVARHAISVVKAVAGDDVRRVVVDSAKCANCHEWFEGHGGNRVYQVQVCVTCHVPGLVSSGKGISDKALETYRAAGLFTPADTAVLATMGITVPNPVPAGARFALAFPQTSNNFKDMIHGLHAAANRAEPIEIVRDRTPGAITILSGAEITYPGILNNCEACHTYNGYSGTPVNAFASRQTADNGAIVDPESAKASLATANATDKMTTAFTAACVSCHDTAAAQSHMTRQGGQIMVNRSDLNQADESCVVCHGAGERFDPVTVHKL